MGAELEHRPRAGLRERQILQIGNQALQKHRFFVERRDRGGVSALEAVLHALEQAAEIGDRGAQLVSDVAYHLSPEPFVLGEFCRHRIECARQLPDLVVAARVDANG